MRKLLAYLLCVCIGVSQLSAQTRTVTGKVTDEKGVPLAAVTVTVLTGDRKVTTTGVTDLNGSFSLPITEKSRSLQFSYIGLEEQIVAINGKNAFSVTLKANARNLSEVVVVGYGTQQRKELTGSLATIKGPAIAETPIQSFEDGLAGRAAGVQITVPSGVVNQPPVFRIRGTNSISLSSYPLIVVDGVPSLTGDNASTSAPGNPLSSINPNDIESIDIAKDAAATAIYGSRAANGVVFITTKKGRPGRPRVTYDGWVGENTVYGLPKLMNAAQYIAEKTQAVANNPGLNPANITFNYAKDKNGNNVDTRWSDYIYRHGKSQSHTLSVSGGNDNTTYYLSTGYTSQQGILKKNDYKRINILANIDSRINKVVSIGGKLSYSNEKNLAAVASGSLPGEAFAIIGLGRIGQVLPPILAPYNNDGTYNINGATIGYPNITGNAISYYNPVPLLDQSRSNNEINHIQPSAYFQVKPVNWLTLRSSYGLDFFLVDNDLFSTPITGDGYAASGSVSGIYSSLKTWLWTNTAQFDYTIADKHNISVLVGNEQQRRTSRGYGINRQTLSDPAFNVVEAGYTLNNSTGQSLGENYLLSSFGRLNYNFDKKYFLSGTIRSDEYSAFAINHKRGIFGSASAAWEIAQENFWRNAKLDHVFSTFKLRGSYGKVGNSNGLGDFASFSTYGSGLYGGLATLSFFQGSVGNPTLGWETSWQTDIGLNMGILNDRITGQFAYFNNNVSGLILNVTQSPSAGLPSAPPQNVGTMYNRGVEVTLNATPVQSKAFTWNTSFNFTYTKNLVTSLAPGLTTIQTGTSGSETVNQTKVGYSQGYLWVIRTGGVDPESGKRIFINSAGQKVYYQFGLPTSNPAGPTHQYQYSTTNDGLTQYIGPGGATAISQGADAVMYKNSIPKYVGGWSNTFNYKGFTLDVLFTYQLGFWVYYGTNAGLHDQRFWNNATDILTDAWTEKGQTGKKYAKTEFNDNVSNGSAMPMDINVFKGDFVKLRNVSLSYNLPSRWLERAKISSVRLYVSGQNLGIWSKYPGPDPEVSSNGGSNGGQGVDRNTIANARTYTLGANIGF